MADHDGVAPVIPLFGARSSGDDRTPAPEASEAAWRTEWDGAGDDTPYPADEAGDDACDAVEREIAERTVLRRLRTRSLSVREARAIVAQRDLDDETVDAVVRGLVRYGYLDDAALAEQLIHSGSERKGQGRQVIAQTLAKRGIARDVADAALAELPDDDADRALEFARGKARSMASLDRDTALRRLVGQLSRRGYPGSVSMTAARQALDESDGGSGVRFR